MTDPSEDLFRLLVEGVGDYGIFMLSPDGTIATWNAGAQRLKGYTAAEVIGRHFSIFYTDEQRAIGHPERELELATTNGRYQEQAWRVRKDGSLFWADVTLAALRDEHGELRGFGKVTMDLTATRRSEAKFEGLLEAAPDAMIGVDDEGVIRLVNGQAERLFGYARQELLGGPLERLVPDSVRAAHPGYRMGYFEDPQLRPMGAGLELSGRRKDGSQFPAEISLSSIDTADGLLVTAAVRDVSERKAFEQVVARARDVAEKAARSRQEFLANMSHEIRTPMNAVIGMTSLLLDTALDSVQRDYVETVRASGEHLLTIINDILDYSKIDSGKLVLEELPFSVAEWLQQSVDLLVVQAHEKGLEVVCDVEPGVPEVVVGDPGRLRQVLTNLLSNAVKFTEHGEIVVRISVDLLTRDSHVLRVTVTDTGVGVLQERVAALFDPFTQADTTTTRVYGGTGLGLAICRQLVERMGGVIDMTSDVGQGTTVAFTFVGGASRLPNRQRPEDLAGKRVLIVDDNATNRRVLESWARRRAMHPEMAQSGQEALALLDAGGAFDVALLDLMMPGMDGAELGVILRERLPAVKLFLLTSAGPYSRELAQRGTFDAYLSKPVAQELLFNVIGRLLHGEVSDVEQPERRGSAFALPGVSGSLSILVVEDNPVNQKVARHLLARFGFRADVAATGLEALSALEQRWYDLVLMDVQMPEMDGLEATQEIRRRWPERPLRIVAMTANVAAEDVRRCNEAGMDGFLAKPIVVEDLAAQLSLAAVVPLPALVLEDADRELLDHAVIARLREQLGSASVRELAGMFYEDLEVTSGHLAEQVAARDRTRLGSTAHKVKSSARSLGASVLGAQFHQIEQVAGDADWDTLAMLVDAARVSAVSTRTLLESELSD